MTLWSKTSRWGVKICWEKIGNDDVERAPFCGDLSDCPKNVGIIRTTSNLHFKTNFRSIWPLIIEIQLSNFESCNFHWFSSLFLRILTKFLTNLVRILKKINENRNSQTSESCISVMRGWIDLKLVLNCRLDMKVDYDKGTWGGGLERLPGSSQHSVRYRANSFIYRKNTIIRFFLKKSEINPTLHRWDIPHRSWIISEIWKSPYESCCWKFQFHLVL